MDGGAPRSRRRRRAPGRPLRPRLGGALAAAVALAAVPAVAALAARPAAPVQPAVVDAGATIYQTTCASCHGTAGEGRPGTGVQAGPALRGLEVAYVDLVLRTGRMPIADRRAGVVEEELPDDQRERLVAWAADALDLQGALPTVRPGDAADGLRLYAIWCASCHGASAEGGIAGGGTVVPGLHDVDAVTAVEAIRVGPFEMPQFSEELLSDGDAEDIAAFLEEELGGAPSPLGLNELGHVLAAILGAVVVGLLGVAVLAVGKLGTRLAPPEGAGEDRTPSPRREAG